MFEARDMRMAPYELVDIDDRLELHLEVPGIKRNTSCQDNQVFCGNLRQTFRKRCEQEGKRYVYSERLLGSFFIFCILPFFISGDTMNEIEWCY